VSMPRATEQLTLYTFAHTQIENGNIVIDTIAVHGANLCCVPKIWVACMCLQCLSGADGGVLATRGGPAPGHPGSH
jgi:hypothetical protein